MSAGTGSLQWLVRPASENRLNSGSEPLSKADWRVPVNAIELTNVEMQIAHVRLPASPKDGDLFSEGVASLKVDAPSVARKICDNESRCIDLSDDFIVNSIYVLDAIDSERIISGTQHTRLQALLIRVIELSVEPHCNKSLHRRRLGPSQLIKLHIPAR